MSLADADSRQSALPADEALSVDAAPAALPAACIVRLTDEVLLPEHLPALKAACGDYCVMLAADGTVAVTTIAIIRMGLLNRFMKKVPRETVALDDDDAALFTGCNEIVICTPPFGAAGIAEIAEAAMIEEYFISSKLALLRALDAVGAADYERLQAIVADIVRSLDARRRAHEARRVEVQPPTGLWQVYSGPNLPNPDRIASAIKGFANHSTQVYPPLPKAPAEEFTALVAIVAELRRLGRPMVAAQLRAVALATPEFATAYRIPELFDGLSSPVAAWPAFGPSLLRHLLSEELTYAAYRAELPRRADASRADAAEDRPPHPIDNLERFPLRVTPDLPFILTGADLTRLGVPNLAPDAVQRLDHYVGGYLSELDLSRTMITGSAIAAALIVTRTERQYRTSHSRLPADDFEAFVKYSASHYAAVKTVPVDQTAYYNLANAIMRNAQFVISSRDSTVTLTVGDASTELLAEPGADVDMAIDVDSNEAFDEVVRGHYAVIRRRVPTAILERSTNGERYTWKISGEHVLSGFRTVELYRANFGHIITHHVGMVSGAYTAVFGDKPEFVVSARLACAMCDLATPNYYYFASRKQLPQIVVMKYAIRGFALKAFPDGIVKAILASFRQDARWAWVSTHFTFPAIYGKGNFSVFTLADELKIWHLN